MTTKEYLQQVYKAECKIKYLQGRREQLRSSLYSIGSPAGHMNPDKVQSSIDGDRLERLIAKVDQLERNIVEELHRLMDLQERIAKEISSVQNPKQRYLLRARYINFNRWEKIATDLDVSLRYVYMLHGIALQSFDKVRKN